jgi:CrcB protein
MWPPHAIEQLSGMPTRDSFRAMTVFLSVALGGAIGSAARYLLSQWITGFAAASFPVAILAINVLGSFAMGVLAGTMALAWSPSLEIRSFLTTGILGGFTTFSAFSLDAAILIQRGELGWAGIYVGASVLLSISGLFAGLSLTRAVLS